MDGASQAIVPVELDTPEGLELIEAARGLDPLSARGILARQFPGVGGEVLRAAVAQAHLQQRASARFNDATSRWWTADGLEQASRPAASMYRASRLHEADIAHGVDLTCGLGLDLLTMAEVGIHMVGVEQDAAIADLAARNAVRMGLADRVTIVNGACDDPAVMATLPSGGVWFVDPARRTGTRRADGTHVRLRDPEQWSPPWSWVKGLAERVGTAGGPEVVVAKTSPAIDHELVSTAATQWLSCDGEVVEATTWWGLGEPGSRCAVILTDADRSGHEAVTVWARGTTVDITGLPDPGQWLIEPDPAVIRAGAVTDFATEVSATLVDEHLAYLSTSEQLSPGDRRGRCWQVLYAGGYDHKVLRATCLLADITRVDVSGRGRQLDAQRVKRDLRLPQVPGQSGHLFALGLGTPRRTAVVLAKRP